MKSFPDFSILVLKINCYITFLLGKSTYIVLDQQPLLPKLSESINVSLYQKRPKGKSFLTQVNLTQFLLMF